VITVVPVLLIDSTKMSGQHDHIESHQYLLRQAEKLRVPGRLTRDEAWHLLETRLEKKGRLISLNRYWQIAASVALLVSATLLLYQLQHVEISTARAQQKMVYLPDSSSLMMNAESTISYNRLFWRRRREVKFTGEGFFQVRSGETFEVKSPNGITQVLGTSFNIISRDRKYKVSCISGRVRVINSTGDHQQILTHGLSVTAKQEGLHAPQSFDMEKEIAWQNGEFYFEGSPFEDVLNTIRRQYDVIIDASAINTQRIYTGSFNNRDIDEALRFVCLPLGLKYEILSARKIRIYQELNV